MTGPIAPLGRSGFVELSVRDGDFSARFGVRTGEAVYVDG